MNQQDALFSINLFEC